MAQKSREDLTQLVEQKVYDNTQKEILASMMRDVLFEFKDSHFNWISDQLKTVKYNETQTLEQYLNAIAGSVPTYGRVLNFDVGAGSGITLGVDGIISSAVTIGYTSFTQNSLIEINFSQSIATKRLIPVLTTAAQNWDDQNDVCAPTIRRISTTQIHLALKQVENNPQNLDIEIIAI